VLTKVSTCACVATGYLHAFFKSSVFEALYTNPIGPIHHFTLTK
jgi:hypothetical protein